MSLQNTIVLVMDQLINYEYLPDKLKKDLRGYNAFKSRGIEFTNIHNNRQMCSPSRASFLSSQINIGVQDNIDQPFQYDYVSELSTFFDTVAKSLKRNNIDITGYYGKEHVQSVLDTLDFITPRWDTNTIGCLRKYGFDQYTLVGDSFYYHNEGYFTDNYNLESLVNDQTQDYNYYSSETNQKLVGALPFLKARKQDNKSFHLQFHLTNPHDTQFFWQNFAITPNNAQLQYWTPFLKEQTTDLGIPNPYEFDENFKNAYINNTFYTINYFEDTYKEYSTNKESLLFLDSYLLDYVTDSYVNSIFPYYASLYSTFSSAFCMPTDRNDVKSWKNLINNYYGLIRQSDDYLYKIYKYLEENYMFENTSVVIMADHGDQMSAHGLKQKGVPFRESVNVPFIVCSNSIAEDLKGTKCDILGSLLDMCPTIEVLANISNPSKEFLGKSLVKRVNNKIVPRDEDLQVFQVVNSYMNGLTYFSYNSWYNSQPLNVQNKVVNKPDTFYNYQFCYTMIIEKYNNFSYKFVRYFNIVELFLYNFLFNDNLLDNGKEVLLTSRIINENIPVSIKKNFIVILDQLLIALDKIYPNGFTFQQGFNLLSINSSGIVRDNNSLNLYMLSIQNYVKSIIGYNYLMPGVYTSYDILKNSPRYYFYCYDLVNDPSELYNLADPNYPERDNYDLFNLLNNRLNEAIINNKCENFTFIVPENITRNFLYLLKIYGENISDFDKIAIINGYTSFGLNNLDSDIGDKQKIIDILLEYI